MSNDFFKTLNKKPSSPFKKISDLSNSKKYLITYAENKDTKYGRSVQMTINEDNEEIKFFLPKRYSKTKKNEFKYFF